MNILVLFHAQDIKRIKEIIKSVLIFVSLSNVIGPLIGNKFEDLLYSLGHHIVLIIKNLQGHIKTIDKITKKYFANNMAEWTKIYTFEYYSNIKNYNYE